MPTPTLTAAFGPLGYVQMAFVRPGAGRGAYVRFGAGASLNVSSASVVTEIMKEPWCLGSKMAGMMV